MDIPANQPLVSTDTSFNIEGLESKSIVELRAMALAFAELAEYCTQLANDRERKEKEK